MTSRFATPGSTTTRWLVEVDLEDAVHARERDDDAAGHRRRAAGEPRPGAARDERHALAVARAEDGLHLLRRAGQDDELGNRAMPGEAVALVDAELLRLRDDVLVAERARSSSTREAGRLTPPSLERPWFTQLGWKR